MNVKLMHGIAGDGCGGAGYFMPRQIIKCSDAQGARWIEEGMATEASPDAEIDGEHFEHAPKPEAPRRRGKPAQADARAAETPEKGARKATGTGETCAGTTKSGNPCKRSPLDGSEFCAAHQEDAEE
jgi:hypothetical protein